MYYTCKKVRSTGYVCRNTRYIMVMFGPSCDGLLLEQQCQHYMHLTLDKIIVSFQKGSCNCPYDVTGSALLCLCVWVCVQQLSHSFHSQVIFVVLQ